MVHEFCGDREMDLLKSGKTIEAQVESETTVAPAVAASWSQKKTPLFLFCWFLTLLKSSVTVNCTVDWWSVYIWSHVN